MRWIIIISLAVAGLAACTPRVVPEDEQIRVVEGGGSAVLVAKVGPCKVWRLFPPYDDHPIYIAEGAGCSGMTR